jgi:hypothetical protein
LAPGKHHSLKKAFSPDIYYNQGMKLIRAGLTLAVSILSSPAAAQNSTTPGEVSVPYPTLRNLAVEWAISGDDNLNGVVTVRYRQAGSGAWHQALPLKRIPAGSNEGFSWTNRHSGSIFDLEPDTEYEIELVLTDPDGGSTTRTVTARTRPVPRAPADAPLRPATPATFSQVASSAQAGDVILLADGQYSGFTFQKDGSADRPIVIRAEHPKAAVINGDVRLDGRSFVFVEGLTVNGMIKFNGARAIVVRGCTVNTADSGIVSMGAGVENAYIADNIVIGPTGWSNDTVGANGNNLGEGIQLTGPGNVIEYNFVKGFRDAISLMEDSEAVNQVCIDIMNNRIEVGADDAVEADFCMGNCRVMRNYLLNSFMGVSSQPSLGGPTYIIRNVMYNIIYSPFKLYRGSSGDVVLHNTVVKCGDALMMVPGRPISFAFFRNNLLIGGAGGGTYGGYSNGNGRVIDAPDVDSTCSLDYDGYGSIGTGRFEGNLGGARFYSLAELRANTSEVHAVQLDLSVFVQAVEFPASGPFPERAAADLQLTPGGAAIDRGELLPNVNDGFSGTAPDLGAYEQGETPPHYGPRGDDTTPPQAPRNLVVTPPP